ncbi:hypothetical protein NHX12_022465 [Muraenolepis orangiensis]|uniref:Uncharacterized protein n=1 Tax=Muraenolepis orangiensis TaxID=630683 RepID=A0A9Q0EQ78_9TELE|nr:hypothetical protein NHX12_022465 [Muraenolepis orangiensis]
MSEGAKDLTVAQHEVRRELPDEPEALDATEDCESMENTQEDMSSSHKVMDFGAEELGEEGAAEELGEEGAAEELGEEGAAEELGEEGAAEPRGHNGQKSSKRPNSAELSRALNPRPVLHLSCSSRNGLDAPDDVPMLSPESPVCKQLPADGSAPDRECPLPDLAANADRSPGILEACESAPPVARVDSGSLPRASTKAVARTTTKDAKNPARFGSSHAKHHHHHDAAGRHAGTTSRR